MSRSVAETMAARAVMGWCVALAIGLAVGSLMGARDMRQTASDCKAAVVASLDDRHGAEGAFERYEEYAGKCVR